MANERLRYLIEAVWDGGQATATAKREIGGVGEAAEKSDTGLKKFNTAALGAVGGLAGLRVAAKQAYQFISEGAALSAASSRFDNLAASIGSTGDALLGKLKTATKGMVSDAELVQGATDIINTGLAKTEQEAVRLATAVSTLGLDMQQVILTFANNSTARLDSLGLAISDVTKRAKELEAQGLDADKAFDMAVLEGLEAKMTLLGDASETTAGKIAQMEANVKNLSDAAKIYVAESDLVNESVSRWTNLFQGLTEVSRATSAAQADLDAAVRAGIITQKEANNIYNMSVIGVDEYQDQLDSVRKELRDVTAQTELATFSQDELNDLRREAASVAIESADAENQYFEALWKTARINEELVDKQIRRDNLLTDEQVKVNAANEANAAYFEELKKGQEAYDAFFEYQRRLSEFATGELPKLTDAQRDEKNELLETAAALGVTGNQFAQLAAATGDYTDAQIEAALEAALMQEKIKALAAEIASGETTVANALDELDRFKQGLAEGKDEAVNLSSSVEGMSEKIRDIPEAVTVKFRSDLSEWQVPTDFSGAPQTAPGRIGGEARATGGPVFAGRSYIIGEQGAERFVPKEDGFILSHGETQRAGQGRGNQTVNIYASSKEAMALALANVEVTRSRNSNAFMGVA